MQTCMRPSWCHCHSLSLASVKSRLVLPFWYRLTRVVPEKGPLNGCVCVLSFYDKIRFRVFFLIPICHSKNRAEDRGAAAFHVRIWPRKLPHTFAAFNARYVRGHWATFGRTGFYATSSSNAWSVIIRHHEHTQWLKIKFYTLRHLEISSNVKYVRIFATTSWGICNRLSWHPVSANSVAILLASHVETILLPIALY